MWILYAKDPVHSESAFTSTDVVSQQDMRNSINSFTSSQIIAIPI